MRRQNSKEADQSLSNVSNEVKNAESIETLEAQSAIDGAKEDLTKELPAVVSLVKSAIKNESISQIVRCFILTGQTDVNTSKVLASIIWNDVRQYSKIYKNEKIDLRRLTQSFLHAVKDHAIQDKEGKFLRAKKVAENLYKFVEIEGNSLVSYFIEKSYKNCYLDPQRCQIIEDGYYEQKDGKFVKSEKSAEDCEQLEKDYTTAKQDKKAANDLKKLNEMKKLMYSLSGLFVFAIFMQLAWCYDYPNEITTEVLRRFAWYILLMALCFVIGRISPENEEKEHPND